MRLDIFIDGSGWAEGASVGERLQGCERLRTPEALERRARRSAPPITTARATIHVYDLHRTYEIEDIQYGLNCRVHISFEVNVPPESCTPWMSLDQQIVSIELTGRDMRKHVTILTGHGSAQQGITTMAPCRGTDGGQSVIVVRGRARLAGLVSGS